MPTKFKRYHCALCNRTVVTWKLLRFHEKKICPDCLISLEKYCTNWDYTHPNKRKILARSKIIYVDKQSPRYGGA
jgi:hypothetical protein